MGNDDNEIMMIILRVQFL